MNQKTIEDWQHFSSPIPREDMALPGTLRIRVQADLNPLTTRVALKILGLFLSTSTVAYFAYPYSGLDWLFHFFGNSFNIFSRGFFFATLNLWTIGLLLTPEQMTAVSSRRIIVILGFIAISFASYAAITLRPFDAASWLWLLGAIVAAIAQANLLFPISQS